MYSLEPSYQFFACDICSYLAVKNRFLYVSVVDCFSSIDLLSITVVSDCVVIHKRRYGHGRYIFLCHATNIDL